MPANFAIALSSSVGRKQALKASKKKQQDIPGAGRKQGQARKVSWSLISIIFVCLVGVIAYSNSLYYVRHRLRSQRM